MPPGGEYMVACDVQSCSSHMRPPALPPRGAPLAFAQSTCVCDARTRVRYVVCRGYWAGSAGGIWVCLLPPLPPLPPARDYVQVVWVYRTIRP